MNEYSPLNNHLLQKFESIINYQSEYNENGGLQEISLETYVDIDRNGLIRFDIWIAEKDFLNNNLPKHIAYKHQTAFKLKRGELLTEDDFWTMFKMTEQQFFDTKISFPDKKQIEIKNLLPKESKLQEPVLRDLIKQASLYIKNLWGAN